MEVCIATPTFEDCIELVRDLIMKQCKTSFPGYRLLSLWCSNDNERLRKQVDQISSCLINHTALNNVCQIFTKVVCDVGQTWGIIPQNQFTYQIPSKLSPGFIGNEWTFITNKALITAQ